MQNSFNLKWIILNLVPVNMKRLFFLCGVLLIATVSCEKGNSFSNNDLIGKWKQVTASDALYTPSLSFNTEGEYSLTDIVRFNLHAGISFTEYNVTGSYLFEDNKITFSTATVSFTDDTSDPGSPYIEGNPIAYSYWSGDSLETGNRDTGSIINTGYTPKVWEVIDFADNILKVSVAPGSVLIYKKQE